MKSDADARIKIVLDFLNHEPPEWLLYHSLRVALRAWIIAEKRKLDALKAYRLGIYHDIGRIKYKTGSRHTIEGYNLLKRIDPECARICLTHSFPTRNAVAYQGFNDCTPKEIAFIQGVLNEQCTVYDDIICLADCYGTVTDFVDMDTRFRELSQRIKCDAITGKIQAAYRKLEKENGIDVNNKSIYNKLVAEFSYICREGNI